jgi:glycine betaine/proline transport system substrate-binding protein
VIGHLRLPSGELAGALLQCVLERLGHRVELVQAPARDLLARMGAGEIHLVSSAALQLAGPEWNRLRHDAVEVAALSEGHRFLWSIPDSPALRGVRTIADLARAPVRREVAAVEGGPAAHQSRAALQAYGLDAAGFRIREETMAHWRGLCRQAGADPDGFVIAHPSHHLLPEECEFRALADPLRALGGEFRTASVARAAVAGSLPPRTREVLRRVFTGAADLTEMEAQMRRMQAAPRALARAWLDANTRVSSSWLAEAPASQPR